MCLPFLSYNRAGGAGGRPLTAECDGGAASFGFWFIKGCGFLTLLFPHSTRAPRNRLIPPTTVQPSFSTIRCKTLNLSILSCYTYPVSAAMLPPRPLKFPPRPIPTCPERPDPSGSAAEGSTALNPSPILELTPPSSLKNFPPSFQTLTGTHFATPFVFQFMQE